MARLSCRTAWAFLFVVAINLVPSTRTGRFSPVPPAAQAATLALQWQLEVVDDSANVGRFASLAVDVEDRPHISYYDETNSSLKVARDDGTTWQFDSLNTGSVADCQTSLALDAAGGAHVSYCGMYDDGTHHLKYAYHDGAEWQTTIVSAEAATHTSLAVDSTGQPHICYQTPEGLRYARREGESWSFGTVDPAGSGSSCSLAVDGADVPHVAFRDASTGSLKYAFLPSGDGAEWQVETVGDGLVDGYTSLALSAGGLPRIAYRNITYFDAGYLEYAWHDGNTWQIETADGSTGAGWFASLALDAAGQPRIAYYRPHDPGELKVAQRGDAGWVSEVVDSGDGAGVGRYASLGLDAAGNPHIAYRDDNSSLLKHAAYDLEPPQITGGPFAGPVTSNTAHISWLTNKKTDSRVRYGQRAGIWDLTVQDPGLVVDHGLDLSGLKASTLYHYFVESTDASGNTVRSKDGFFVTEPKPDASPPSVGPLSLAASAGPFGYPVLRAPATDNTGVGRVQFTMDSKLVGTAYSPSPGGDWAFPLPSPHLGLDPADLYGVHDFGGVAYDAAGLSDETSLPDAALTRLPDGKFKILAPNPGQKLYAPDGTTPPGTTVEIEVYASQYLWECLDITQMFSGSAAATAASVASDPTFPTGQIPTSMTPSWCRDVERAVEWVDFYLDNEFKAKSRPDSDRDLLHEYTWNASGLAPGVHAIKVVAQYSDEDATQLTRVLPVEVVQAEPSIEVSRQILRIGHYFQVQVRVDNQGYATIGLDRLIDNMSGFQAIRKAWTALGTAGKYSVTTETVPSERRCDVTIDLATGNGGPLPLAPGGFIIVEYLAVPVLYADTPPDQYMVGEELVQVRYQEGSSWSNAALDRPTATTAGYTPLVTAVSEARAAANYLIVSNPSLLFVENPTMPDAVNELLSAMAELAQLKTGILGDLTFSGPLPRPGMSYYGPYYVRALLDQWGAGMRDYWGYPEFHPLLGYVLLVGEEDTLPAKTLSKGDWTVHLSDLWYGDTNGDWPSPDRIVGRIIGDNAAKLILPIQTSINVHRAVPGYHFDRNYALSLAGRGEGRFAYQWIALMVYLTLSQEFSYVERIYQKTVEDDGLDIKQVFRTAVLEKDVIFYRGLAATNRWGDGSTVVNTGDLIGTNPIGFGSAKPFVFGCASLSGNYSGVSLAEAFLQNGAVVYIGATEVADRTWNNTGCHGFYLHWVDSTNSIGKALRDTKLDITVGDWWSGYEGDRWAAMYNLYGDPTYGGAPGSSSEQALVSSPSAEPPTTISVEVPDYEVTTVEGVDHVDIPGGNLRFELGKPLVPIYTVETEIPEGYRVQDVQLSSRSGLVSGTGLNLPLAELAWDGEDVAAAAADLEAGWWPDEVFDWEVRENTGGGSTLVLRLSPFYYDPATTNYKFYKDYEFDVESSPSSVAIELLATDRATYPQGDPVLIDLWLNNTGDPKDVLFEATIRSGATGEVADGLPLKALTSVDGLATYFDAWDTTGQAPGSYYIEGVIRDSEAQILDRAVVEISLGISLAEVTALSASPDPFETGDPVNISLAFANIGTVPISGTAQIEILASDGTAVAQFSQPITALAPDAAGDLNAVWDTAALPEERYRILGQVLYDSKATEPWVIDIQTRVYRYLPWINQHWP